MSRKSRKYEKEIIAKREAEARIEKRDQQAVARKKALESSKAKNSQSGGTLSLIVGLVVVAAIIFLFVKSCGGGDSEKDDSSRSTSTSSAKPTAIPKTEIPSQTVIGQTVSAAESRTGLTIDPVDIAKNFIDDVDTQRSIWDRANWKVVAECDVATDGALRVGVVKIDEWNAISQAGMASGFATNKYKYILGCPA